jgi:hypothetical protein
MYHLVIDNRERAIIPNFQSATCKYTYPIVVQELHAGDFAVVYKGRILFLIERKTYADLSATVKDIDRKFNYKKMLEVRAQTGCKVLYGIEGDACPADTKEFQHIAYSALRTHLDHLMFDHDIHVFYAKTKDDFVRRVFGMMYAYATRSCEPLKQIDQAGGDAVVSAPAANDMDLLKHNRGFVDDEALRQKMWHQIKGVTVASAGIFSDIDFGKLYRGEVTQQDLANRRYLSGHCIGPAKAKTILESAAEKETQIDILTCLNGVTKPTAKLVIDTFGLPSIIKGEVSNDQLANLMRPTGKRIGNAIASKIHSYFAPPPAPVDIASITENALRAVNSLIAPPIPADT